MPYHCYDCQTIHYEAELCEQCKIKKNKCPAKCGQSRIGGFGCIDKKLSGTTMVKVRQQLLFGNNPN